MKYTLQFQNDNIADSVRARFSMIVPILQGMLYSSRKDIVEQAGGYENITLEMFCRIYLEHPGDYGICFEYALHKSIYDRDRSIYPLISEVLEEFCGIKGAAESILFGVEKKGGASIIETAKNTLTDQSKILVGKQGRAAYLKRYLDDLVKANNSRAHAETLPRSIRGIWKADLFLGSPESDNWVATTLKTNRRDIEHAPGLRVALYPEERQREGMRQDENMIYCPLPYSGDFMQLFGASFQIVKQIVAAKGKQPSRIALVYEDDQYVAQWLTDRAHFPLLGILDAIEPLKQPSLLIAQPTDVLDGGNDVIAAAPIPYVNN